MTTLLDSSEIKEAASLIGGLLTQGREPASPVTPPADSPMPVRPLVSQPETQQVPVGREVGREYNQQTGRRQVEVMETETHPEYESRVELMTQSPSPVTIRNKAAAFPTGAAIKEPAVPQTRQGYETMFDKMTQSPSVESIEDKAAALPTGGFSIVSAAGLAAGITHGTGPEPQPYSEYETMVDKMTQSPSVESIGDKAAALHSDGFSAILATGLAAGVAHKAEPGPQLYSEYEAMADKMAQSPGVQSIEEKAAALPTGDDQGDQKEDALTQALTAMCRKGAFAGALLADTNGSPLSVCNQPLNLDEDVLAGVRKEVTEMCAAFPLYGM